MASTLAAPPSPVTTSSADSELLTVVRRAVSELNEGRIVAALKEGLVDMARCGRFDQFEFPRPRADRYARRLVFSDAWERFTIIAMTWDVGQRTPLHDHAGVWCVEVVVDGDMEVINYQLVDEKAGGFCRFEKRGTTKAHPASSGALIPPFEHHVFGNCGTTPSHTLHIYGGPMNRCSTFVPTAEGWYERQNRELRYDAEI